MKKLVGLLVFLVSTVSAMVPQTVTRAREHKAALTISFNLRKEHYFSRTSTVFGRQAKELWSQPNISGFQNKNVLFHEIYPAVMEAGFKQSQEEMEAAILTLFKKGTHGLPEVHIFVEQTAARVLEELKADEKYQDIRTQMIQADEILNNLLAQDAAKTARRQQWTRYALIAAGVAVAAALATFALYKMVQWSKESKEKRTVSKEVIE